MRYIVVSQIIVAPSTAKPRPIHAVQKHAPLHAQPQAEANRSYPYGLLLVFMGIIALLVWASNRGSKARAAQAATAAREQAALDAANDAKFLRLKHDALQPVRGVPITLQPDETCYFSGPMTVWTKHTHTYRVGGYAGPSFRVARGVSFRVGAFKSAPVSTTDYEEDDQGTLYITTQRIAFTGQSSTRVIKLKDVVSTEPFSDGIQFDIANKNSILFKGENGLAAAVIFLRVQAGAIGALPASDTN